MSISTRVGEQSRLPRTSEIEEVPLTPERRSSSQRGSGSSGSSSIESMGGGGAANQTKSFAQKFFEFTSKLWCCGPIFKMIAGWFNIVIDDNGNNNIDPVMDRAKQTLNKKVIEKVFANKNHTAGKIGEAQ